MLKPSRSKTSLRPLAPLLLPLIFAIANGHLTPLPSIALEMIRPLSADRPDATESAYSVPQGMFQIESSALTFSRNDHNGTRTDTWAVAESNLKYGLTHNTDLQLVVLPWLSQRETTAGSVTEHDGFGGLQFRTKINLWGNDSGPTAFALLPYVTFPIQSDVDTTTGEWEGGLITPFSWSITDRLGYGMQVELARFYDDDFGHLWGFAYTAVLSYAVTDSLGVFVEYAGFTSKLPYEHFINTGATYLVNDDFQLDAGLAVGLNEHTDDLTTFAGFTLRF
ncbi:MAG: transporter [Verrucomicrobiota bacterium]